MRTFDFGRVIGLGAAVAVLVGCNGSRGVVLATTVPAQRGSWMSPESQSGDLLYVSIVYASVTNVYTYPGLKLVGGLSNTGYTNGLCSNNSGDVFITTEYAIYEYPHGLASPIAMLTDPQGQPYGCSVDATTGKLAVVSGGGVAIYRPAGHNQWYLPHLFTFNFAYAGSCAYDGSGDLFVDGQTNGSEPLFVELLKGASKFVPVTLNRSVPNPGNLEWDGKNLAVGDGQRPQIHRFAMNGTRGTQIGLMSLSGVSDLYQFWIAGSTLIGPAFESHSILGFWKYPAGGSAYKKISESNHAFGTTVSVGKGQ